MLPLESPQTHPRLQAPRRAAGRTSMSNTKDNDVRRDVLNRLVLKPRVKQAARDSGIHPTTLFGWIKQSVAGDPKMVLMWLGHEAPGRERSIYAEVPQHMH